MLYMNKKVVLATNDSTARDTARLALAGKYSLFAFPSAEKLMQHAERMAPDLILLGGGLDTLGMLRAGPATRRVPVIYLTKPGDLDSESAALELGAADCVQNTASPQLLRRRVDLQVGADRNENGHTNVCSSSVIQTGRQATACACASAGRMPFGGALASHEARTHQEAMLSPSPGCAINARELALNMVVELVECRDGSTRGHIDRTERFMRVLTGGMASQGVYLDELNELGPESLCLASKLHDLGKVGIRDSILRKPGVLTMEEFEEMKTHTTIGEEVIDRLQQHIDETAFFSLARVFAGSHHERWDGSGYPRGLRGKGIPLAGRLMAIVDVYDALTSERPYKPAYPHELASSLILEESGRHFDPALVRVFAAAASQMASVWAFARDGDGGNYGDGARSGDLYGARSSDLYNARGSGLYSARDDASLSLGLGAAFAYTA